MGEINATHWVVVWPGLGWVRLAGGLSPAKEEGGKNPLLGGAGQGS